jgi:hypothetical protein
VGVTAIGDFVERWEAAVACADVAAVEALLAEDVTFRSPALFRPTVGRGPTTFVLAAVLQVFGELRYTHRYADEPDGVTLQFETSVHAADGRCLEVGGVDIFRLDVDGRIASLTVMLRPLNATQAVAARMREQLGLS